MLEAGLGMVLGTWAMAGSGARAELGAEALPPTPHQRFSVPYSLGISVLSAGRVVVNAISPVPSAGPRCQHFIA